MLFFGQMIVIVGFKTEMISFITVDWGPLLFTIGGARTVLVLVLLYFALLCFACLEMFTRGGATLVSLLVKP